MGATRALVTMRDAGGKVVYVNDRKLAEMVIQQWRPSETVVPAESDEFTHRAAVVEAGFRLQSELAAAVKAMFGQAAEKAKAYTIEQEQMAKRLAGKRRRKEEGAAKAEAPESSGPGAAAAAEPTAPPSSQPASSGESLKERASRICHPQPPQADSA